MLRRPAAAALTAVCLSLAPSWGCDRAAAPPVRRNVDVRVAVVGESKHDVEWRVIQAVTAAFRRDNPRAKVETFAPEARSPAGQREILRKLLADRFDAVCVSPTDPSSLRSTIEELARGNVRVVTFGRDSRDSKRAAYCGPVAADVGQAAADACDEPPPAETYSVGILHAGWDHPDYGATYRAVQRALRSRSRLHLLREVDCRADPMDALRLLRAEAAKYPRIRYWILLDDWPYRALPDDDALIPSKDRIVLCDGSPRRLDALRSSEIHALIAFDYHTVVREALWTATLLTQAAGPVQAAGHDAEVEIIRQGGTGPYARQWDEWTASSPP